MVSEQKMAYSYNSGTHVELVLSIQTFYQCASLISFKLILNNYLLWQSQVLSLIHSLGIQYYLKEAEIPFKVVKENKREMNNLEFVS